MARRPTTRSTQEKKGTRVRRKAPKGSRAAEFITVGRERIPSVLLEHYGITPTEFDAIAKFAKLDELERISASRKLIQECIIEASAAPDSRFALAVETSQSLLDGYATLDAPHRAEIKRLIQQITAYLHDATRKRPFNALMLAAPGAGKSHFIKQLAKVMKGERVEAVTFNMATMQSQADMAQPIDELRNLKVNDRYPLLFLDEFDSDERQYAALLPLLWDGELHLGHRDLKLGKSVIVLAGSSPDLPKAMAQSAAMRLETEEEGGGAASGKLVDLLSRINGGVINIPDLDLRTAHRDRRVDKVCVTIALLKGRFGDELVHVPRAFLRFVAHTTFRYGVRSLAHLIDIVDLKAMKGQALRLGTMGLPMATEAELQESSLRLHLLDKDQGFGIVNRWKEFSRDAVVVSLAPPRIPWGLMRP